MPEMASYALPVYKAVVTGLALKALQEEEPQSDECKILQQAGELLSEFDDLLANLSGRNFTQAPRDGIGFIATGLALLISISREIVKYSHDQVQEVPEPYQTSFRAKLAGIAMDADRAEELAEAWFMALDEELVASIKKSVEDSRPVEPEDIPDWRDVLAKLPD